MTSGDSANGTSFSGEKRSTESGPVEMNAAGLLSFYSENMRHYSLLVWKVRERGLVAVLVLAAGGAAAGGLKEVSARIVLGAGSILAMVLAAWVLWKYEEHYAMHWDALLKASKDTFDDQNPWREYRVSREKHREIRMLLVLFILIASIAIVGLQVAQL